MEWISEDSDFEVPVRRRVRQKGLPSGVRTIRRRTIRPRTIRPRTIRRLDNSSPDNSSPDNSSPIVN